MRPRCESMNQFLAEKYENKPENEKTLLINLMSDLLI